MIFYDFEVFRYDWMVTFIDMIEQKKTVIVNDQPQIVDFYDQYQKRIFIGCNNHHYDDYILKGLLCDFNPWDLNEWIITEEKAGWAYSNLFRKIPLISYDVMVSKDRGLKTWEGFLGNSIKESSVDFRIDRKLTEAEIQEVLKYNLHDVEQTIEVFMQKKADFDALLSLIKMFPDTLSLKDIGLTKAQMSAKILGCERVQRDDRFDLFVLPCIDVGKYRQAQDFFMDPKNHDYDKDLTMTIAGVEHTLAWGGIHGARKRFYSDGSNCQMWHVDVASFYPRLMIFHNLLTRNAKYPERFRQIYEKRLELKHAGKKKEQAPLKIVINGTFGITKYEKNPAYDERQGNLICINGELMLIDLINRLEKIEGFVLVQSNTDGLIVSLPDTDEAFDQMDDICYEWETRCNMVLEFDRVANITQKDVNNYLFQFENGKIECKGAYVKELSPLDYDLPIVNKALVNYMTKKIPVERTILECDDLIEFQMVRKIGKMYSHLLYGGYWKSERRVNPKTGKLKTFKDFVGDRKRLPERCVRVFASKNITDGGLWKVKNDGSIAKVEGTPEHCFIYNDAVNGKKCPSVVDKQWYVNTAKSRLKDFGL